MEIREILIVDDDREIRETLRYALEYEGYGVCTARNGVEALKLLAERPAPRLILLDLMMPEMSGWEFLAARQRGKPPAADVPVVVISASGDRARTAPAQGVLHKPICLDDLLSTVKRFCS